MQVYSHREKKGSDKYCQLNPYNKNEAYKSVEQNASKTIEQNMSKTIEQITSNQIKKIVIKQR